MATSFGAIFDWDGVVIDSRDAHEAAWEQLGAEEGRAMPAGYFEAGFGRTNRVIIPEVLGWAVDAAELERLSLRKEEIYREILFTAGPEPLPGVRELLDALAEAGVPCAVGTSAPRLNITTTIEALGLEGRFKAIVSAEDVIFGKPDPDVFLKCAARIGRRPGQCVVFEDAHHGIEAALAGGMIAVAVATTHPLETFVDAHLAVERLTAVTLGDLEALVAQRAAAATRPA